MSVTVRLRGRLGSNLFQYAVARIVAERHGLELRCLVDNEAPNHQRFDRRIARHLALAGNEARFPNTTLSPS